MKNQSQEATAGSTVLVGKDNRPIAFVSSGFGIMIVELERLW